MVNVLRKIFRKIVPDSLKPALKRWITPQIWKRTDPSHWPLPKLMWKEGLERYEYSLFSQNGEDGILRYLFSEIGVCSKLFLEFGFEVTENNSLRLMLKERFGGVFMDGSETSVKHFNATAKSFGILDVHAVNKFLNLENLEPTIIESKLPKEIDLLSIDVDGNDYWFWQGIGYLSPRVVVIEYNASLGPELSLTVPYDPGFDRHQKHASGFYCGASIAALERLGKKKGYSLVGCDSKGVNAFFVRNDCLTENLKILPAPTAYRPHKNRLERGYSLEEQFRMIKDLPFINIE